MSNRRNRLLTRGHLIAWAVSLALGIVWVVILSLLPADLDPVVLLLLRLVGIFGFFGGILIATGMLVQVLGMFGTRPGALGAPSGEVPADRVFGICVILFALPSLLLS